MRINYNAEIIRLNNYFGEEVVLKELHIRRKTLRAIVEGRKGFDLKKVEHYKRLDLKYKISKVINKVIYTIRYNLLKILDKVSHIS
jgi:hypothetical protein